jgi:hypothetical protein
MTKDKPRSVEGLTTLDDFLDQQGTREAFQAVAIKEAEAELRPTAAEWRRFEQTLAEARAGFADLTPEAAEALIAEAMQKCGIQELIPGRREARARVIAAGLTDDDIDKLIEQARQEVEPPT